MSRCVRQLAQCVLTLVPCASGCTYFEITVPGRESKIATRSMEFGTLPHHLNDWAVVTHPVGTTYHQGVITTSTVKYGHVSIDAAEGIASEGMNEKGLALSANILNSAKYATYDPLPGEGGNQLLFVNLLRWALSECATTEEMVNKLDEMTISSLPFGIGDNMLPIHWAVTDVAGDSRVIQCTDGTGKCNVYKNEVGLLTNDPVYPWMVANLEMYAFLSPDWVLNNDAGIRMDTQFGVVPISKSQGYNLKGLPGDSTPASRFVRVFYQREFALRNDASHLKRPDDYMFLAQSLINSVFIPKGVEARKTTSAPISYTQWTVMRLSDRRQIFLRSYNDMQWRQINLDDLPLGQGNVSMSFPVEVKDQSFHDIVRPAVWSSTLNDFENHPDSGPLV